MSKSDLGADLDYLESKIAGSIGRLLKSHDWYRRRHYLTSMGSLFLTGMITVVAGLELENTQISGVKTSNVILLLGAAGTMLAGWGTFFSPKESWRLATETLQKLYALQDRIGFEKIQTQGQPDPNWVQERFGQYLAIVESHSEETNKLRKGTS